MPGPVDISDSRKNSNEGVAGGAVTSVFTRGGAVIAVSGDYGVAQVAGAAPLASPALTGTPTVPTAAPGTGTTQAASTAFVSAAVTVESARAQSAEGTLAPLASPAFTGIPTTATTPAVADNSLKLATTAYADRAVPAASSSTPLINGTATAGTGVPYSRQDHVHPTDTTRAPLTKRITTLTSSATPAVNTDTCDVVTITAQAAVLNMTTSLTGTPTAEQQLMYRIKATGAFAITWGASFITNGDVALPTTTVSGKTIRVGFVWDEVSTKWTCVAAAPTGY